MQNIINCNKDVLQRGGGGINVIWSNYVCSPFFCVFQMLSNIKGHIPRQLSSYKAPYPKDKDGIVGCLHVMTGIVPTVDLDFVFVGMGVS